MKKLFVILSVFGFFFLPLGIYAQGPVAESRPEANYSESSASGSSSKVADDVKRFSLSTNFVEWANLGTLNVEGGAAFSQNFSIHAGVRYNPWTYIKGNPDDRFVDPIGDSERQFENRKQAYSLSVRWWPWYIYSGWWGYVKGQYMEYNRGGLIRHTSEEGDAVGGGLGIGYTHMLHKNWNIEFGAGLWAGKTWYTDYRCTNCGSVVGQGDKFFLLPDDVFVSLVYIF